MITSKTIIWLKNEKKDLAPQENVACITCTNAIWTYDENVVDASMNKQKAVIEAYCKAMFKITYSNLLPLRRLHCDAQEVVQLPQPLEQAND